MARKPNGTDFTIIEGGGKPNGAHKPPDLKVVEDGGKPRRRSQALPANLPPRGLVREEAAAYVGVSATIFDDMIADGVMPNPWRYHTCVRWDSRKLDAAIDALDSGDSPDDPWARMA